MTASPIKDNNDKERNLTPPDLDGDIVEAGTRAAPLPRKRTVYVAVVFVVLLVGWPTLAIFSGGADPQALAARIEGSRLSVYFNSFAVLWMVFLLIWSAQRAAKRPLSELGFTSPRLSDPLVALAFLFGSNLLLNGLGVILTSFGLKMPDVTVSALLPQNTMERFGWVILSISAGICEESCFRGFLLLRGKQWLRSWIPIVLLSSLAFGSGHLYQGGGGAVLIFVYGVMFCGLRLWRGSLWPGIWAHIWQDLGAMALGQWAGSGW